MELRNLRKGDIVRINRTVLPEDMANEPIDLFMWDEGKILDVDRRRKIVRVFFIDVARRKLARMSAAERAEWSALNEDRKKDFATYGVDFEDLTFFSRPGNEDE